jgi:hypothetical protein
MRWRDVGDWPVASFRGDATIRSLSETERTFSTMQQKVRFHLQVAQ